MNVPGRNFAKSATLTEYEVNKKSFPNYSGIQLLNKINPSFMKGLFLIFFSAEQPVHSAVYEDKDQ
jgi:hypothetical protein